MERLLLLLVAAWTGNCLTSVQLSIPHILSQIGPDFQVFSQMVNKELATPVSFQFEELAFTQEDKNVYLLRVPFQFNKVPHSRLLWSLQIVRVETLEQVWYYKYHNTLKSDVNEMSGRHAPAEVKTITDVLFTVAVSFLRNWEVPPWKDFSGMSKIARYNVWWLFEMASTLDISDNGTLTFRVNERELGFATESNPSLT